MRGSQRKWTQEEEDLLRDTWRGPGARALRDTAAIFGRMGFPRSPRSLQYKARTLRLAPRTGAGLTGLGRFLGDRLKDESARELLRAEGLRRGLVVHMQGRLFVPVAAQDQLNKLVDDMGLIGTWLTSSAAGRRLGLTYRRVLALVKDGTLVGRAVTPRSVMVCPRSVQELAMLKARCELQVASGRLLGTAAIAARAGVTTSHVARAIRSGGLVAPLLWWPGLSGTRRFARLEDVDKWIQEGAGFGPSDDGQDRPEEEM